MLLDLANREVSLLHTSHSVHPKNKDHNSMKQNASALTGQALHLAKSWAAQYSPKQANYAPLGWGKVRIIGC